MLLYGDGNPENNHPDNLRYGTRSDNAKDRVKHGNSPWKGKFGKDNHNSKKILQFNKNGILIKEWGSSIDCSRELNINKNSISNCIHGLAKTAGGFKFLIP